MNGEQIETLIELFRQETCLWNSQDADYMNADSRAKALKKMSEVLHLPAGELHRCTYMWWLLRTVTLLVLTYPINPPASN
jgi:hypothetical protein